MIDLFGLIRCMITEPISKSAARSISKDATLQKPRSAGDDVRRLAFSITGLALHIFICRDVIETIRSKLIKTPAAVGERVAPLVDFAEAMVAIEMMRRPVLEPKQ